MLDPARGMNLHVFDCNITYYEIAIKAIKEDPNNQQNIMLTYRHPQKRDNCTIRKNYVGLSEGRSFFSTRKTLRQIVLASDNKSPNEAIVHADQEERDSMESLFSSTSLRKQYIESSGCIHPTFDFHNIPDTDPEIPLKPSRESRGIGVSNLSGRTCSADSSATSTSNELTPDLSKIKPNNAHASLILALERTLFAALNNSWLLALGGMGLMSVGNGDDRAVYGGIIVLSGGIASALLACSMHFLRIRQLQRKKIFLVSQTIFWVSLIAMMTVLALALELYFGILYPYLRREKAVSISNRTG